MAKNIMHQSSSNQLACKRRRISGCRFSPTAGNASAFAGYRPTSQRASQSANHSFSEIESGEGKRRKEFAEWYVEWRAEWHNYAKNDLRGK